MNEEVIRVVVGRTDNLGLPLVSSTLLSFAHGFSVTLQCGHLPVPAVADVTQEVPHVPPSKPVRKVASCLFWAELHMYICCGACLFLQNTFQLS